MDVKYGRLVYRRVGLASLGVDGDVQGTDPDSYSAQLSQIDMIA